MNAELYTAASGLIFEARRMDMNANNLANVRTDGYRAQRAFASEYASATRSGNANVDAVNRSVALAGAYEVPGGGPLQPTGNPLDIALPKDSVLQVQTPQGPRYTRSGSLRIDADGVLTDISGNPVLRPDGETLRGLDWTTTIRPDGEVSTGEIVAGQLAIFTDPDGLLIRRGDNLLDADGRDADLVPQDEPGLHIGWLQSSGTDPVRELVYMIETQRAFETYQKLISLTMNEVNRRAVSEIAGT